MGIGIGLPVLGGGHAGFAFKHFQEVKIILKPAGGAGFCNGVARAEHASTRRSASRSASKWDSGMKISSLQKRPNAIASETPPAMQERAAFYDTDGFSSEGSGFSEFFASSIFLIGKYR